MAASEIQTLRPVPGGSQNVDIEATSNSSTAMPAGTQFISISVSVNARVNIKTGAHDASATADWKLDAGLAPIILPAAEGDIVSLIRDASATADGIGYICRMTR